MSDACLYGSPAIGFFNALPENHLRQTVTNLSPFSNEPHLTPGLVPPVKSERRSAGGPPCHRCGTKRESSMPKKQVLEVGVYKELLDRKFSDGSWCSSRLLVS